MSHQLPPTSEPSRDPLRKMRVFELADELMPDAWNDAVKLKAEPLTEEIAGELYDAVCSIAANISEGYSRSSGKDRARIFEFGLGSVRESMSWYRSAIPVLGNETTDDRLKRLEEMRRLLLAIIPRERGKVMKQLRTPPNP